MAEGPVTEVVYMHLKPGLDLESGEGAAVLEDSLKVLEKQEGLKTLYYGRQIEHPDILQMVVAWTDISYHRAFEQSPAYQPFLDRFNSIQSADAQITHVKLSDDYSPFNAPVTECITAYFAPDADPNTYITKSWLPFQTSALAIPDSGAKGIIGGWAIERLPHEALGEGVEGQVFKAYVGWDSMESHMEFRETEAFAGLRPVMRGEMKGAQMYHVKLNKRV
ncbi:hypothetical protein GQ44DRAFT_128633 [Phaeosphaeriaceae sp. PMI808]|nr:hypothetical protein GQ44DRAFT_128633 [Phaeosphaeriaceae sp. PMI808]